MTLRNTSARRSAQKAATTSVPTLLPARIPPKLATATASISRQRRRMKPKSLFWMPLLRMSDISVGSSRSQKVEREIISVARSSLPK